MPIVSSVNLINYFILDIYVKLITNLNLPCMNLLMTMIFLKILKKCKFQYVKKITIKKNLLKVKKLLIDKRKGKKKQGT